MALKETQRKRLSDKRRPGCVNTAVAVFKMMKRWLRRGEKQAGHSESRALASSDLAEFFSDRFNDII
jgi:hypothetical protein